jgi:histidyl-tRNA synthetase
LFTRAGVAQDRLLAAYGVIDKLGRESAERTHDRLRAEVSLDDTAVAAVLQLFESASLDTLRKQHGSDAAVARELDRLDQYAQRLAELGLADFIRFDPTIVRGLAYYTGTVFEIFDRQGELRAICGGGRYDRLLASVSSADMPAVGFGMGDVVLTELLRDRSLLPDGKQHVDVFMIAFTDEQRPVLLELAQRFRAHGRSVLYPLKSAGVGKQLKEADARGARHAILIGPDELARGAVVVRSLATGEQREVTLEMLRTDPLATISS